MVLCMATTCEDDTPSNCEERLESLAELKIEIESLVNTSVCNENTSCRYMAFGSKPCGGPWSYLIYSTSIDTLELKRLVDIYNDNEEIYNIKCDAISDCAFVNPPIGFDCENNICIPVY